MSKRAPDRPAAECPICRHRFPTGTTGWYSHIGAVRNHPNWHPEVRDPNERKRLFMLEFPEFFKDAWTPSRRHTPLPGAVRAAAVVAPVAPPPGPAVTAAPAEIPACPRFCYNCGVPLFPTTPPR